MAITLQEVIRAARDRHPAFSRERVPDAVIARYLSDTQNELISSASIRDRSFMAQTAVVSVLIGSTNVPGVAGAGTSGGLPGNVNGSSFATSESSTGSLIETGVTAADGATVLIPETTLTSATGTTLTKTGAARTVNGDIGKVLVITTGLGFGQRREVVSNTATVWTVAAWDTIPDTTSLFALVTPLTISDDTAGVVTALPSTTINRGYLVKLNSSGTPFIDYTQPLVATLEQGIELPTMQALLPDSCQWWQASSPNPFPLRVISADKRWLSWCAPTVYTIGRNLYLNGSSVEWANVQSLELRYVPVAPAFTSLADLFLLPDYARAVLVAKAAALCAMRVEGMEGVNIDSAKHGGESQRAESQFRQTVFMNTLSRGPQQIREAW